jgi:glycosyltransferase involved in cell wall biosynthesis
MHIVTDYEYYQYLGQYRRRRTRDMARCFFDNSYLYEWNEQMASVIIGACDMALIPIPMDDPLAVGKAANKLLLFWRMGVPVVVSATPAYASLMERAGLRMACRTPEEWEDTLERYIRDPAARKEAGQRGKDFAEEYYGEKNILALWDDLFHSVLSR